MSKELRWRAEDLRDAAARARSDSDWRSITFADEYSGFRQRMVPTDFERSFRPSMPSRWSFGNILG
jgi:hypothetical protein